ncbi:hypothetical protein ABZ865_40050 [Streptomyces sp. NPDC047085]|uniref:hypothetical protein n=1 Tax=Streptomyces sp. NPDC047085 TaxID=3155140 RepID=UPI00340CB14E
MDLESVAKELYTLHPTRFVGARTARVDEALAAGKAALAAQIAALRRPTLSAWAGNLLVHAEPKQVARLLRLGESLRRAHRNLDRAQLRRVSRQQHVLVAALSERARALTAEMGHPIGPAAQRKVEQTLHAALADRSAAEKWATGRLVKALVPPADFTATAATEASARRRTVDARTKPRQSRLKAEAAERRDRERDEEQDQAQAEVDRLEAALRELEERATVLAQQLHATAELRRRTRDDLDQARNRAAQANRAARKTRHAAGSVSRTALRGQTAGARASRPLTPVTSPAGGVRVPSAACAVPSPCCVALSPRA